jgi:hypothetical protein
VPESHKESASLALQDSLRLQGPVLIGLIAHLSDSTLQDDIASTARGLLQLGQDILARNVRDAGEKGAANRAAAGTGCFELIAGKSIPEEGPSKVFAGVVGQTDTKPKRRLHKVLMSQGCCRGNTSRFSPTGGDTVRALAAYLHPHSEHILDWFHIGMRVEQLSLKGLNEN